MEISIDKKREIEKNFTKYEIARILGARALQLSMNAPVLLKIDEKKLEEINYDPLKISELEFYFGVLPITVKRPLPSKTKEKILERKIKKKKMKEVGKEEEIDKEILKREKEEERKIAEEGEIMELAKPEDESEETQESKPVEE